MNNDLAFMQQALQLAQNSVGLSLPNPAVGCVIVQDGQVIGSGWTQAVGGNHAEIEALHDAAAKGYGVRGATVYVTLEPCNHFGHTPPCCDALIAAGIARLVAAVEDPNPQVAGRGLARLRAAGIEVDSNLMAAEAREMNLGFFSRMQRGRPWVRLKAAASLDGRTALKNGLSQWITSPAARVDGHAWRARAGAILSGIGTIRDDDPLLTVRAVACARQPQRVVVDSSLAIDLNARVLAGGGTWIATAVRNMEQEARLREVGAEVIFLPNAEGKVDLSQLMQELGRREINELHVEAGARLNGALIAEGCIDELLLYLAPQLLGPGLDMFDLPLLEQLKDRVSLRFHDVRQIGEDLRVLARFG